MSATVTASELVPVLDLPEADQLVELDERTQAYIRRLVAILDRQTGRTAADNALDREDTIQEVFVQLLEARANGVPVQRQKAYVDVVTRGVMRNVGPMRVGSTDRQAIIRHSAWRREFTFKHGREPSRQESDAAAVRLREDWPDRRHRPTEGFHKWVHGAMDVPVSLDQGHGAQGGWFGRELVPDCLHADFTEQYDRHLSDESAFRSQVRWAELAEACLSRDCFEEGTKRQARILLYPALAQGEGAPIPNLGVLGRCQVQAARRAIEAVGGVAICIELFSAGEVTTAVEAFFAPWRDQLLSHRDRQAITAVFRSQPTATEDLWESALKFASREQQETMERILAAWLGAPPPASAEHEAA